MILMDLLKKVAGDFLSTAKIFSSPFDQSEKILIDEAAQMSSLRTFLETHNRRLKEVILGDYQLGKRSQYKELVEPEVKPLEKIDDVKRIKIHSKARTAPKKLDKVRESDSPSQEKVALEAESKSPPTKMTSPEKSTAPALNRIRTFTARGYAPKASKQSSY